MKITRRDSDEMQDLQKEIFTEVFFLSENVRGCFMHHRVHEKIKAEGREAEAARDEEQSQNFE
jgi:hypothetical protein